MSSKLLSYLVDFIDDDSTEVRDEVRKQLSDYGYGLEDDLNKLSIPLDSEKMKMIFPFIEDNRRNWIFQNWHSWSSVDSYYDKLETALNILSKFHYGINYSPDLTTRLDMLAEEFKNKIPYGDELDLSFFLFKDKMFNGAKLDYYNPFNSNLIYTLNEKKGLPITLSLIYMLIGWRCGFIINGFNYPGNFMTKIDYDDEIIFVDCFAGGKLLFENDIEILLKDHDLKIAGNLKSEIPVEIILTRVLNNLINSYSMLDDNKNIKFFSRLRQILRNHSK